MATHWPRHSRHWQLLGPPLRPHADVVERVQTLIGAGLPCLLLGSTVEYAILGPNLIAMDASFSMISALWRSADSSNPAIQSDWTSMPIGPRSIAHVLGDGSLNAVSTSVQAEVLKEITRVLTPGGSLIARVFCRPAIAESADDIRRDVELGRAGSFHALKWRVAMAALRDPASSDIAVSAIRDAVVAQYPDRDELCRITGWDRAEVDTLDVYDGSSVVYNFPTEASIFALLQRWFATVEIIRCGAYPLAERCPLLVARRPLSI
ncbi:MAG TPA: class I SAM-dependent methyltransferase [Dongiaceae bacterium]|nr:class I SAM-dependent methyltransferase [Dongiaceae bacterium]